MAITVPVLPPPLGTPGTIGLTADPSPLALERGVVLLRFDGAASAPEDDAFGGLAMLTIPSSPALTFPAKVAGWSGQAIVFASGKGLFGKDLTSGATLLQRDLTIQAIIAIDVTGIGANGTVGTIYCRGLGSSAPEYASMALQLRVDDSANRVATVRAAWADSAGTFHTQTGAQFVAPSASSFTLLTVTRRWVSATSVVLRYYFGAQLVAEVTSSDGDIGGGTAATTSIGARLSAGSWVEPPSGCQLDELMIVNYEMSQQEVESTWLRLSDYQPDGYRQILDALPPGAPISFDPSSDVQNELKVIGAALGYAEAQAENARRNLFPDRAYGDALREWERVTHQQSKPGDSIDARRARVLAHLAQKDGCSVAGATTAIAPLLGVTPGDLDVLAFDATIREDFSAGILAERWTFPRFDGIVGTPGTWDVTGGQLRAQAILGSDIVWDGAGHRSSMFALQSIIDPEVILETKVTPTSFPDGAEGGVVMMDWVGGHAFFFGVRRVGAAYKVGYQRFQSWGQLEAFTVVATTSNTPHWLILRQQPPGALVPGAGNTLYTVLWSTTSATSGFSSVVDLEARRAQWAGLQHRSSSGLLAAQSDCRFDDVVLRVPYEKRPDYWYVFRDPGLGGSPDLLGADQVVQRMKQAHTYARVITSKSLLCDNANSGCDRGPMGAL